MNGLEKKSKLTLQQQIAEQLEIQITSGELQVGQRLPSMRALGRQYDVSHETGKGAINILQEKGLVEIIPSKGAFVVNSQKQEITSHGLIGVVIDNGEGTTPKDQLHILFGNILTAVHDLADEFGWHPVSSYVSYTDLQSRAQYLEMLKKIDGLIIVNLIDVELIRLAQSRDIPVVALMPATIEDLVDVVGIDYIRTYFLATQELIERGCRHITYMDNPKPFDAAKRRWLGVKQAVAQYDGDDIILDRLDVTAWTMGKYQEAVEAWLKEGNRPDVIISANDHMGVVALNELQRAGIRSPEEIMVLGSRNTSVCELSHPTLSSIDFNYEKLVEIALKRINERIQNRKEVNMRISINGHIVFRDSIIDTNRD
ncbi:MAG: substrate-binding domain-containing protein [Spirochaetia bacterium]|nr:substrate-binding domain-containing protein [Spirochaetia bacterium]